MMKKLIYLLLFMAIFQTSCVEDVVDIDSGFIKVLGQDALTEVRGVVELSNGDYMILGKIGKRSFNDVSNNILDADVQKQAAGLMITDHRGNIKTMRLYPIEEVEVDNSITLEPLNGKVSLLDAIELDGGGYLVIGQLRDFDITIDFGGGRILPIISDESSPSQTTLAPILLRLSPSLEVINIRMLTGESEWDNSFQIQPKMRKMPDGNIALVFGQNVLFDPDQYPNPSMIRPLAGYRLMILDQTGDEIIRRDYNRDTGFKHTRHFEVDENNNIYIIGERNAQFAIFELPAYSWLEDNYWDLETFNPFANSGNAGLPNTNGAFIHLTPSGGLAAVYTNPPQEILISYLNSGPNGNQIALAPETTQEYPRATFMTQNGDLLIYSELLNENSSSATGYLTRLDEAGQKLWRIQVEGVPKDVMELSDGNILTLTDRPYNESFNKGILTKFSADGKIF